jgi:hypothetical protein
MAFDVRAQGAHNWESHPLRWEEDLDANGSPPVNSGEGHGSTDGVGTRINTPSMAGELFLGSLGRVEPTLPKPVLSPEDESNRKLVDVRGPDLLSYAACAVRVSTVHTSLFSIRTSSMMVDRPCGVVCRRRCRHW